MKQEYAKRLEQKGAGRTFHSLKGFGNEIAYVNELVEVANGGTPSTNKVIVGHTPAFHDAYARRVARQKILFSKIRDAELEASAVGRIAAC